MMENNLNKFIQEKMNYLKKETNDLNFSYFKTIISAVDDNNDNLLFTALDYYNKKAEKMKRLP